MPRHDSDGTLVPWWMPLLVVVVIATAIAYVAGITASEILGSRLASFLGLLEVVAATFYAWLLLGEQLSIPQLGGGVLILVGIVFVRSEKSGARLRLGRFRVSKPDAASPASAPPVPLLPTARAPVRVRRHPAVRSRRSGRDRDHGS